MGFQCVLKRWGYWTKRDIGNLTTRLAERDRIGQVMPAGDAQRTWFPEMVETLRMGWHAGLPFEEVIALRDQLDAMLHRIRAERHIRPPVIRCTRCGHVGEAAEPDVSVRAVILSLGRFGIASADEVKTIEKRWGGYRKMKELDLYGKTAEVPAAKARPCAHSPGVEG